MMITSENFCVKGWQSTTNTNISYLLDWNNDSAEKGLGFGTGLVGNPSGLAVDTAGGGNGGGANIGAGNGCMLARGGVGLGTDVAGDSCELAAVLVGVAGHTAVVGFEKARLDDTLTDGAAVLNGVMLPRLKLLTLLLLTDNTLLVNGVRVFVGVYGLQERFDN